MITGLNRFLVEAKKIFPEYDYSKVKYINSKTPVTIICPIHGEFKIKPEMITYYGYGCPDCRKKKKGSKTIDTNEFVERARKVHGDKYDYSKVIYKTQRTPVTIICPIHGEFEQLPMNHLRYAGCPQCGMIKSSEKRRLTAEEFIERARKVHGNKYDYSKVNYRTEYDKVTIICPKHGEFEQTPGNHMNGQGCMLCVKKTPKFTTEEYIQKVIETHPNKHYIFDKTVYTGHNDKLIITCPKHGDFEVHACNFINTSRNSDCPKCSQERLSALQTSKVEKEVLEFIKSLIDMEILENYRGLLSDNREIDIFIPERKLGIEFDGIYWHSELSKPYKYHLQKTEECEKQGIQLIHIFENEWLNKQDIVKSRLRQLLGITKYKIPARKCTVKVISSDTEKQFMNNNHLQGYVSSTVCYGLYYEMNNKEYLVACMSFGNLRKNLGTNTQSGTFELYRFCCLKNFTIIGGASKLFKHFINVYKPNKVISFANRRYSTNIHDNLYVKLRFKFDSFTPPSYFYIVNNELVNRFNLRKDILISKYGCPKEKSEHQFCMEQGWYRIYDCGNLKYVWNKNN